MKKHLTFDSLLEIVRYQLKTMHKFYGSLDTSNIDTIIDSIQENVKLREVKPKLTLVETKSKEE